MLLRVIDLETSGFPGGSPPHGPVEAAYTDLYYEDGKLEWGGQDTTLLNPKRPIHRSAEDVHGISDDMVEKAPDAKFVSNFFHHKVTVDYIVAHNMQFEANWVDPRTAKSICTLIAGKHVFPGHKSYKNGTLFNAVNGRAILPQGFHIEPAHRALPDTVMTAAILYRMLEKRHPDELVAITAGKPYGKKLPIGKFKGLEVDDKLIDLPYLEWLTKEPWVRRDLKEILDSEIERRKNA